MPILNVKVSAPRTPELSERISEMLLELTSRVLGKRRDLTAVVIDYVDPVDAAYGFGGKTQEYRHQHPSL